MYILNKGEQNMSTAIQPKTHHSHIKTNACSSPSNLKFVSKKTFYKHNKPNTNQQYMLVYPPLHHYHNNNMYTFYTPPAPYLLVTTLQNFRKAVQRNKKLNVHPIVAAPTTHVNISNSYNTSSVYRKLPYKYSNCYTVALVPQSKQKRFYKTHTLNNNVKYL